MVTIEKINISPTKTYKILLAPLDWGLGHATRCIPIIKELLNQKCEVWIAASGAQKALLREEFPFLSIVELPGYNVKYGKNRAFTLLKILSAIPKILIRIKREKAWLRQFLVTERPDAVISDNRYGLHAPGLFSVFITHQLHIKTPFGPIADNLLQRLNYRAIHRFSLCWVPDWQGAGSLAGQLSHPDRLPLTPTRYIGILSRFERQPPPLPAVTGRPADPETKFPTTETRLPPMTEAVTFCDLLILLSGPEPQRTIFEKKILDQLPSYPGSTILIRGLPGETAMTAGAHSLPPRVRVYNHLPANALNAVVGGADLVLSRAGYSTIMDLLKLGKRAILVPTPGQTEQEYLGEYLSDKKIVLSRRQSEFSLSEVMTAAQDFPFAEPGDTASTEKNLLQKEIRSLLDMLDSSRL